MRRSYLLWFVLSFVLLLGSCKKDSDLLVPGELFGTDWLRTSNQDAAGNYTYQPSALTPPRLGNDGFRFESDGSFIKYSPAATDGTVSFPGTWTTVDGQTFHITLDNSQSVPYDLVVEVVNNTTLKARQLP